jgi:hypothetical protein
MSGRLDRRLERVEIRIGELGASVDAIERRLDTN